MLSKLFDRVLDHLAGALLPHIDRRIRERVVNVSIRTEYDESGFHASCEQSRDVSPS